MKTSLALGLIVAAAVAVAADKRPTIPDYQPVVGWPAVPADLVFGMVSAVATDSGDNVYVLHRGKRPVVVFDRDGKFLRAWGDEQLSRPHGLRIDGDGNLWITDIEAQQVIKFSPDGKPLMMLGKRGRAGDGPDHFNKPTDVAIAPSGDFYVSDGYGNSRVAKFTRDGKFASEWGKKGKGAGEFNLPHAIVRDKEGRLLVADRENKRVQIFDANGKYITQWRETGAPYGLFLAGDRLLVADGLADWILVLDRMGKPIGRWGAKGKSPGQFDLPHALCVDSKGAVYVAEIGGKRVQKFVAK